MELMATITPLPGLAVMVAPQALGASLTPVTPTDPAFPKLVTVSNPTSLVDLPSSALKNGDLVYLLHGTRGIQFYFGDNGENGTFSVFTVPSRSPSFYTGQSFGGWPFVVTTSPTNPATGNAWADDSKIAIGPSATSSEVASAVASSMGFGRYDTDTGFSASGSTLYSQGANVPEVGSSGFTLTSTGIVNVYDGSESLGINGHTVHIQSSDDGGYWNGSQIATATADSIMALALNNVTASFDSDSGSLILAGDRDLTVTKVDNNGNISLNELGHPDFIPERYFLVTDSTQLPGLAAFQTLL